MLGLFRTRLGGIVISLVVGFIAFVFVFEFGMQRGGPSAGGGGVAGSVNGETISVAEFNRSYKQQLEFFKSIMGGANLTEDQLKQFRIKDTVFQQLVQKKLQLQEAERLGLKPADEEIRDEIRQMDAFKKDGKFDKLQYQQVLEANQYSTGSFEKLVREDLILRNWRRFLRSWVQVGEAEARREWEASQEKRTLRYVFIPTAAKEKLKPAEGADAKLKQIVDNLLKTFDGSDRAEIQANGLIKDLEIKVQTARDLTRTSGMIAGVGEAKVVLDAIFKVQSGSDQRVAKSWDLPNGKLIGVVTDAKVADASKWTPAESARMLAQVSGEKESSLSEQWLKRAQAKAKIESDAKVLAD